VRDWLFRGLMFEADADEFRTAGIRVGADATEAERSLLDEALSPFGIALRNEALQMSRLYALIYCFETSVRHLIVERLQERHKGEWWEKGVPQAVRRLAESRHKKANEETWLEGQRKDLLGFVDFGDLASIIVNNWDEFQDLIPTQHWLAQRLQELEQARNFIAHSRYLLPDEFQRIEMYIRDWNRQVSF